jgi:cell division protein FtsQ
VTVGTAPSTRAETPVDPRIAQRRAEVRRDGERRRRRALLASAGVLVGIGLAVLAVRSPLLDVDTVDVRGAGRTDPDAIVAAAGIAPGDPLVWLDLGAAAARVRALPWIDDVALRRSWRGDVVVEVTERRPVALVAVGNRVALVDADDRVLEVQPAAGASIPPGLVELRGLRSLPAPGKRLYPAGAAGLRAQLPPELGMRLVAIDLARSGDVVLVLLDAPEVRLGDLDDLAAKGAAAVAVLRSLEGELDAVRYVDVRAPATPTAGRADGSVVPGLDAPVDR